MPKKQPSFEETYPSISLWVKSYGWIEIGRDEYSTSFIRVLDAGGMIWESKDNYPSLDKALRDLEIRLTKAIEEIG